MQRRPRPAPHSRPLPRLDQLVALAAGTVALAACGDERAAPGAEPAASPLGATALAETSEAGWLGRVRSLFHCVPTPAGTAPEMIPGGAAMPVGPLGVPPRATPPPDPRAVPGGPVYVAPGPVAPQGGVHAVRPAPPQPPPHHRRR